MDLQKYFEEDIISSRQLNHRGNNRIYQVVSANGRYAVKKYSTAQDDKWDRGKTEYDALSLFLKNGIANVPKPFQFDRDNSVGIYEWVEGTKTNPEKIEEKNILEAVRFLIELHSINKEDIKNFQASRTSCFSNEDAVNLIQRRYEKIYSNFIGNEGQRRFLEHEIYPQIKKLAEKAFSDNIYPARLGIEEQVITPGDFGFHNILISLLDKHTFVDFEYCGRDDPAKQILDFLHHEHSKRIPDRLKSMFVNAYEEGMKHPKVFHDRLIKLDPIIGMDWVLIYLNPLSRKYREHLEFSSPGANIEDIIDERIEKAKNKMNNLFVFGK